MPTKIKSKKGNKYILFLIIIFGFFIRTVLLDSIPPALFSDEVDAGYQAYIFNKNGTDYFGNKFPVHFHSFADWRTSFQIYSIAFIQEVTNNSELSVRLPSTIYGVISIYLIYLITRSNIAAFLWSISPWAIHFSRTGFEVSGMLTVLLASIYFWKKFILKFKKSYLYLSIFFLISSSYFYSTAKLFAVIIGALYILIWHKEIIKINFKTLITLFILSAIVLLPMSLDTIKGKSGFRFSYISIFSLPHREQITDSLRYEDIYTSNHNQIGVKTPLLSFVYHNKYELIIEKFIQNYISSFSTKFLALDGDANLRQGFSKHGMIYFLDIFLIAIGIVFSFKKRNTLKISLFFMWLLILSPIPYSLTRDSDSPHATRLILMLPSLIYFTYRGIKTISKKYKYSNIIIIFTYIILFSNFWHYYKYHYPQISAKTWHTGMKEAILAANKYENYTVFYSSRYEPFLPFYLFYNKFDINKGDSIEKYLSNSDLKYFSGQKLGEKIYFGNFDWANTKKIPGYSIVVIPKSEYLSITIDQISKVEEIPAKYVEQEEFIILKTKD